MTSHTEQLIDSLFQPWQKGSSPGVQVLIRRSGRDIYEKCFGLANLEHNIPITPSTTFHVASISKQFTVLAALLLWKDGLLDPDSDIREYAEDLISFDEPVSVRQIMNNVSGLRDQWELLFMRGIRINDSITMDDVNTSLKMQRHLNFPPQSAYLYSNMGFHLLAVIVERLSGMTFPEFAAKRIFEPLGMNHTMVRSSSGQIIPGLAYSYQDEGNGTYYYNPLNYSLYGPTSVNTCARDLRLMLDEYIRPRTFDSEIIELMKTPAILSDGSAAEYCGGLMTHQLHGLTVYEHGGADAAYRGHVLCIPEEELEIIMLSNSTSLLMSRLAKQAACLVLGLPDCEEPEIPSEGLTAPRAGRYLSSRPDDPQFVEILEKDGSFFMKREYGETRLIPAGNGGWQAGTLEETLFFQADQLRYRLPNRIITMTEALSPVRGTLQPGLYQEPETSMEFTVEETAQGYSISMLRYGSAPFFSNEKGETAFSFGPDFTMYVRQEDNRIILDGYRVKNLIAVRQ